MKLWKQISLKFNTKISWVLYFQVHVTSTKDCDKCYHQNQDYTETQNTSFLMNEMLWNAMTKASSLDLINQIDP